MFNVVVNIVRAVNPAQPDATTSADRLSRDMNYRYNDDTVVLTGILSWYYIR